MRLKKVFLLISTTIICSQLAGQVLNESFSDNFPPELWKVYNLDGGQFTWTKSTIKFLSFPACARVRFDGRGVTNNDWLVTRKVYPIPGDNLLRFSYRSHNSRSESLEVYVSTTGNQPPDFQYLLTAFGFNNTSYIEQTLSLSQFDSTPIYLAFRYIKRFGKAVYLDNISGLEYLPKDVGVKTIISPTLYVMNGENLYPQVTVKNYGSAEQDGLTVNLFIVDSSNGSTVYNSLQTVNNLAAQDSAVVTFSEVWRAREGVYQVKAFTSLEGDMDLTNDTMFQRTQVVFSEINDVAVTGILNPQGTLPPGTVTPQASVANYGTNPETFLVNFDIILHNSTVYTDTVSVTLEPNVSTTVNFATWDATSGIYQSVVKAMIENDIDTTNNTMTDMFEVVTYYRDVGATQILNPIGELLEYSLVQPQAEVENFGDLTENFDVKFRIETEYEDSINLTLSAGERRTVNFQEWTANEIGTFATKCSTNLLGDEDPLNDFVTDSVIVVPGTGIIENMTIPQINIAPNPFENKITFSLKHKENVLVAIYNAAGVMVRTMRIKDYNCWDGTDDKGNSLPKGIYFLRIKPNTDYLTKKIVFR